MKKLIPVLTILSFVLILVYCGGAKNDPQAVMIDFFDLYGKYADDLSKAGSADDVVTVCEKYTPKFKKFGEKIKAMQEKFPDLKSLDLKGGNLPKEYKKLAEKMQEVMPKLAGLGAVMMKYMNDPKVQEAMKKINEVSAMK